MSNNAILIIGAGLAGLSSAIHLSKMGLSVVVLEKNNFPKHKVCGEYISNEVLPYLQWLGVNPLDLNPTQISKVVFSTTTGKNIEGDLPLGGFGISRYTLDHFLYQKAIANGCHFIQETVMNVKYNRDKFEVTLSDATLLNAEIVLGAFGKRSNIDQKLSRNFIHKKSPWLAVKAHYSGVFPADLVGLYNFKGGYCGVSRVENNIINICYLADFDTFKKYKNIEEYQQKVVCQNPILKIIFENTQLLFEKPLTISQISFERKAPVENHILMIGDTAGLIHPLCGNGMAIAIHSAKIASEAIVNYFNGDSTTRKKLEETYTSQWNQHFKNRLKIGRVLAYILQKEKLTGILMRVLVVFPFLLPQIIKKTHGKPISN